MALNLGLRIAPPQLAASVIDDFDPQASTRPPGPVTPFVPLTLEAGIGRIDLVPASGGSVLTGLIPAAADGQVLLLFNATTVATDALSLSIGDSRSEKPNQFSGIAGLHALAPYQSVLLVYQDGTWLLIGQMAT